jgi:hypothetical protein
MVGIQSVLYCSRRKVVVVGVRRRGMQVDVQDFDGGREAQEDSGFGFGTSYGMLQNGTFSHALESG